MAKDKSEKKDKKEKKVKETEEAEDVDMDDVEVSPSLLFIWSITFGTVIF